MPHAARLQFGARGARLRRVHFAVADARAISGEVALSAGMPKFPMRSMTIIANKTAWPGDVMPGPGRFETFAACPRRVFPARIGAASLSSQIAAGQRDGRMRHSRGGTPASRRVPARAGGRRSGRLASSRGKRARTRRAPAQSRWNDRLDSTHFRGLVLPSAAPRAVGSSCGSHRRRCRRNGCIHRVSQREVPGVACEHRSHLAGDVCVADAGFRIGEAERTACSGSSERALISERPHGAGLHEAQREPYVDHQALVAEAVRRGVAGADNAFNVSRRNWSSCPPAANAL